MLINRRKFIKTGGVAMLGSLAAPTLLGNSLIDGTREDVMSVNFAMNHFGVTESDLKKVITAAMEKGGEYADLFFEHTLSNSTGLLDGEVNRTSSNIDYGMGIRVISGDRTGYAYVENITLNEMLKAARTSAHIASGTPAKGAINMTEIKYGNHLYNIHTSWDKISVKDKMPYLRKINEKMFAADKRIIKVSASISDATSHILFCNSDGRYFYDYRPMVVLGINCIMQENGKTESNNSSRAYRKGAEFLNDEVIDSLVNETIEKTAILFPSVKPKGGEMPVVMGAGGSGILLHEAIGHAFEADFNRKNTSIFSDKLNKKVCNENINIVDDALIANNRGALNIDDEGTEGQKTCIVKDGILSSYMHDRISAKHYGIPPTGNGRRESFRCMPIPRMRATYMEAGNRDENEIIAAVKKGVYVSNFTNGQVQIGAGDFTFYVKNGYLIENGKLTQPVKDINIIGNGPKALADITMVGSNFLMDANSWTCGKDGQSCPVSLGMPSVLVSKLTVGGEN
ncbi:MAG: TldD/PmbA family protein [Tannerella sp.]|jgi:TldD protein|nr:TldD/PmbA family protein [Tannerella sp.]